MAENTEEEHLDIPTNAQSEDASQEITSADNMETITQNPETNNMEVHNHPHHVTHKKKWGEYVLEFLMLFLAVFLGFIAENLRELRVEKVKEKEYMVSMLSDIKKDTMSIDKTIIKNSFLVAGEDSTLHFLEIGLYNQDSTQTGLAYFFKYCSNLSIVHISDGTITQLKNNGGLRLIRNKDVNDKITSYYSTDAISSQESYIGESLVLVDKQAGEVFNYFVNKRFIDSTNLSQRNTDSIPLAELKEWLPKRQKLLTNDVKALSSFMYNVSYYMGLRSSYIAILKMKKAKAIDLISSIQHNYSL